MPKIVGVREWIYLPGGCIDTFVGEWCNDARESVQKSPGEQGEAQGAAGARDPLVAESGRTDEARKYQEPKT